jgi:thiamine transport system ATP-binding protein
MLQVEHAVVVLGGRRALDDVDLTLPPGETLAVLGPSGSGKTTLLRTIAGLQPLDRGRLCWDGADLGGTAPHERRFGLMFQEYALFPHRDVAGNVEFGLRVTMRDPDARERRVDEMLELVGLTELRHRRIATLSGGEQQRVALARALAVRPRLLMLDEPLGALDRMWRRRLLDELRSILAVSALPALYVTHDQDEAFAIADRIAVMRDGRVVQIGTPAEIWRGPADAWTATFLGFGPHVVATVRDGRMETPWGVVAAPSGAASGSVDVVARPDAARLEPAGPLGATVARATFAGTHVELTVTPDAGPELVVSAPRESAPGAGRRVRLAIDAGALLVYPRRAD